MDDSSEDDAPEDDFPEEEAPERGAPELRGFPEPPDRSVTPAPNAGAPASEPFEMRLELGLRRLQSALGWRRGEENTASAAPGPAPPAADAAHRTRPAPAWRARLSRPAAIAGDGALAGAEPTGSPGAPRITEDGEGGRADISLSLFLLEPSPDGPSMSPVEPAIGLDAPRLRQGPATLVARFSGADLGRARCARLRAESSDFTRIEAIDPFAVFEEVGEELLALIAASGATPPRLRLEVFAEQADEAAVATPIRWWSLPLTLTKPTPEPDERRRALAARPRPNAGGPLAVQSIELIDAEADRIVATLADNGFIDHRVTRGRNITVKATLTGSEFDRVQTMRASLETDDGRQIDSDRPFALSGEMVGHFYKLTFARGQYALTIEAYGGEEGGAPLFLRRFVFRVR